ncbi:hypothetical protein C8R43DRAFT_894044 [Mycena crocata]|nr:hypothetical protein C8R43DRAFT_894044 [Mycena crocata]
MVLCVLVVLFHLPRIYAVYGASCACSQVVIPVHVDVQVPKDPMDAFAGLKSNASELRHVDDTYDIYGIFCQPNTRANKNKDVLQLLVHGLTYNSQYWSPAVEEFRNYLQYSYATFSCDRGLSSLAVDVLGVGLSTRPRNASDVQFPTAYGALSRVAHRLKTSSLFPGVQPFKKVIAIGHSAGSALLNFGAIVEGPRSPFDGLILTGLLNVAPNPSTLPVRTRARDAEPVRWSTLDPAYLTVSNRSVFYPGDASTFSPRMVVLDGFTKDVGAVSIFAQITTTSLTTEYTGPVAKVVGSEDQFQCVGSDRCVHVAALTSAEHALWPESRSFELVVEHGSGHDMNLDFFANGPFTTFVRLVNQFADL